jgi:integrase
VFLRVTPLHSIYVEAIVSGRAAHNPVPGAKLKKINAEESAGDEIEMPTMDELRAILSAASGRWRPIIVTAMFTGMRGSELRGLKWEDANFNAGVINVRRRVDACSNFGAP